MSEPDGVAERKNWGLRVMAFSAGGLLLSLGLCGLAGRTGDASGYFLASGILVLAASLLGLVVGVVMAAVSGMRRG